VEQARKRVVPDLRKVALVEGAAVADVIIVVIARVKVDRVKAKVKDRQNSRRTMRARAAHEIAGTANGAH
jgi:citrate lyase gamma subunit